VEGRVDHRSHERRGIEQEATVNMGPSVMATERRAERETQRKGREYEPVTKVASTMPASSINGPCTRIERGSEWLRDVGQRLAGCCTGSRRR
jgi:hypothetical protein